MITFHKASLVAFFQKYFSLKKSIVRSVSFQNLPDNNLYNLFPSIPGKQLQVCVIIPAKDEELYLFNALNALRMQCDQAGNSLPFTMYEVLLLVNNSKDQSLSIAKSYQQKYPLFQLHIANINLPKRKANIGFVRKLLMDEAYRRLHNNHAEGIIASTDADTEVDKQWLHYTIKEISCGSDVVGGRIISEPVKEDIRRYYLQDITYRYLVKKLETRLNPCEYDLWPSHFQCYGASLAVQCSVYKKAGGIPVVPFLEDAAFCSAAYRIDAKIRCSPQVKVYTSSRRSNRVKIGFATHLKHLEKMQIGDIQQYVEAPELLKIKYRNKQLLKKIWDNKIKSAITKITLSNIAKSLTVSPRWLFKRFNKASFFGELWEDTERKMYQSGKWKKRNKHILITEAIQQLKAYVNN